MTARSRAVLVAAFAALALIVLGGLATEIGDWYRQLRQPPWKPPDWLFGPVWTTIFVLSAAAGVLAWQALEGDTRGRRRLIVAYALNGALNVLWSLLFFRWRRPDWALAEVGLLWGSIAVLVWLSWRAAPSSAVLLLPYLAWVGFAALLNAEIVRLNAPF